MAPLLFLAATVPSAGIAFVVGVTAVGAWRQAHHFYYGLALVLSPWGPWWLGVVGVALMWDDAAQHLVQLWRPAFRSPLHLAYRHLLYNPACGVLAWLAAWYADRKLAREDARADADEPAPLPLRQPMPRRKRAQ